MECGKISNIYLHGYFSSNHICSLSKLRCNCMFFGKKKNQSLRFQHQQIIINYKPQYVPNSYSQ